jgi:CHAT domain-containing protein
VADSLNNLAELEAAQGHFGLGAEFLKRGLLVQDLHIQNTFSITTEAEKLKFMETLSGGYQAYLSLLHQHLNTDTGVVRDGMELVLRRKGVVFDAQSRTRESVRGRLSEAARKEWDRLSFLRSELARLVLHKPESMNADEYKATLASLQQQTEESERRVSTDSALVAKELQQRTLTIEQVSKQLPKNAALAEFVKIHDFDFTKGRWKPSSRYLAFVLTAAGNVTLVDLGEANALERQADRTLEDIKVAMNTLRKDHLLKSQESLVQLSRLVWKPLESSLGQADRLIVSPDGQLNLVPFAALVEEAGQPLVERYHLTYVNSGRELITTGAAFTPESDLLLVANPAFDAQPQATEPNITAVRSRDFRRHFAPLPGTAREAEEIPPLVTGRADQKQVLVAAAATEGAVKATRSPRILHLATHGFFLEDIPIELEPLGQHAILDTSEGIGVPSSSVGRYGNPLLRSGLAFAGANRAGEITDGDDGLLTALEITGIDLHGTDLVVLSACETAVGMVHTGEGVFGLRRAFALAGAKNLLMSMWPVDDQVTADQMKAFYQNLQTLPLTDALRQAQRETIRRLKERDGVANPGLWAPFILQGANGFGTVHSVADRK